MSSIGDSGSMTDFFMTATIFWTFLVVTVVAGIATVNAVGKTRAKARPSLNEPARHIHQACAAGGHKYQVFNTGYQNS